MSSILESEGRSATSLDEDHRAQIRSALEAVCHSPAFKASQRSRHFLTFVVEHALREPGGPLKERTVGVEVFGRPVSYSTGEDPIVRVQAGDVRRRLERYYRLHFPENEGVRIALPVGSYTPEFSWSPPRVGQGTLSSDLISIEPLPQSAPNKDRNPLAIAHPIPHAAELQSIFVRRPFTWAAAAFVFAALAGLLFWRHHRPEPMSQAAIFWQPIFKSDAPVLIGVPKSVAYAPMPRLYEEYIRTHPGSFQEEWERTGSPLPLDPASKITWSDMQLRDEFGVGIGTAYAATELSLLFARKQKGSNLRIGNDYSFEDIHKAPTVLLGAFNNRWTMRFSSELPYRFVERDQRLNIEEQGGQKRVWQVRRTKSGAAEDYALVVRFPESASGQFLVLAAGIGTSGSQAAVDFISNDKYLEEALHKQEPGWQNRNLAFVLKTAVTDHVAGPPITVASSIW